MCYNTNVAIRNGKSVYSLHHGEIFRLWRRYPHPAPDKRACRSSGGVCEVDSMSKLIEPHLIKLHKIWCNSVASYFMERYRSGHNGADSKSVCAKAHEGSNPSLCAKQRIHPFGWIFCLVKSFKGIRTQRKNAPGERFWAVTEEFFKALP